MMPEVQKGRARCPQRAAERTENIPKPTAPSAQLVLKSRASVLECARLAAALDLALAFQQLLLIFQPSQNQFSFP
jgi:hypothetical protein